MRLGTRLAAVLALGTIFMVALTGAAWAQDPCEDLGKTKEYEKQIAACTKNVNNNYELYKSLINRGLAYFQTGLDDKAIEDFTQAIDLKPGMIDGYLGRGTVYNKKQFWPEAVNDLTKAIRIEPNNPEALFQRSIAFGHRKQLFDQEYAEDDCGRAIRIDPKYRKPCVANGYYDAGL
jgi:tetratricopeptide (TPR) repeat protein